MAGSGKLLTQNKPRIIDRKKGCFQGLLALSDFLLGLYFLGLPKPYLHIFSIFLHVTCDDDGTVDGVTDLVDGPGRGSRGWPRGDGQQADASLITGSQVRPVNPSMTGRWLEEDRCLLPACCLSEAGLMRPFRLSTKAMGNWASRLLYSSTMYRCLFAVLSLRATTP